jgi:hypothetical protein
MWICGKVEKPVRNSKNISFFKILHLFNKNLQVSIFFCTFALAIQPMVILNPPRGITTNDKHQYQPVIFNRYGRNFHLT